MAKLFWNKEKTKGSFELLHRLSKELDFVLVGGWAVYLYVRQQESLDIDIMIDYSMIDFFKRYGVEQYEDMAMKYSIIDNVYVDIFLTEFSDRDLPLPVSEMMKNYILIDGIKVLEIEMLLIMKLWGYFRSDEVKVRKDILDVVGLLFYGNIDLKKLKRLLKDYNIPGRRSTHILIEYLDKAETLLEYLEISSEEYAKKKKEWKSKIKGALGAR